MKIVVMLLIYLRFNESVNLTYVIKKDKDKKVYNCMAEGYERYEAIDWVYPIPSNKENIPQIITKFIPNTSNEYNCNFSKNNSCSDRWNLRDWEIDDSSIKTREFSSDYRWDDLPTILISNANKEFDEKIEVDEIFRSGFSVRASGVIELLVCVGPNPYSQPCYHFNIDGDEIYLNKYTSLPHDLNNIAKTYLKYNKVDSSILSQYEWRSFTISFDEKRTIELFDVNLNKVIVKHEVKENFSPMYLLMRSSAPSLWKFHKNEFLSTSIAHVSKLGPELTLDNTDLCVSLLVSLCENCEIIFLYYHGRTKKILERIKFLKNTPWIEVKLKDENVTIDKLNIFVETKLKNPQSKQKGFWAIDNVRICNKNEVKISYLKLNANDESNDDITCQMIKRPDYIPRKYEYNKIKDFPRVIPNSETSKIYLSWKQEDTRNKINYFITYQAYDNCTIEPYNLERLKSSGFVTTKYNVIELNDLVPFTWYNVTISTIIHEVDKQVEIKTLETMEPTDDELPRNISLKASNSTVNVSWQEVPCTSIYGNLIYTLIVYDKQFNFIKQLSLETDISYTIDGLQPYTPYSLKIITARNSKNIAKRVHVSTMVLNFTTLPGVASVIENLEPYSTDDRSVSLRYDLPKDPKGKPTEILLKQCKCLNAYMCNYRCTSYIYPIKQCPLWPNKFCLIATNLKQYDFYSFYVYLRNKGTEYFGKEVGASAIANVRIPGAPTNVTYKIVDCDTSTDYCHLNISWDHPYHEVSTITNFNIFLNNTFQNSNVEEEKYIYEVYIIEDKSYKPKYTYQIKYLPYSTSYSLYLQSENALYNSEFTQITVKTDDLGKHINQSVELVNITHHSISFKLPRLDPRLEFYVLTIIVQDFDKKKKLDPEFLKNNKLCHTLGNIWNISQKVENNNVKIITIGDSEKEIIKPKTNYCITFIIVNRYKGTEHDVIHHKRLQTPDVPLTEKLIMAAYRYWYILLVPVLFIPTTLCICICRCLWKKRTSPQRETIENPYESLALNSYMSCSDGTNSSGYLRPIQPYSYYNANL